MAIELPALPFAKDALAPYMSEETLDFHYGKHHQAYVNNVNRLIAGTELEGKSLEEIILNSKGALFNSAAQTWNHSFFWNCLKPNGGGAPTGALAEAIDRDFGSFDAFKEEFAKVAAGQFGSGWGWLVEKDGKLQIISTSDAELPMTQGAKALFTIDVWEHAYYIDYRNDRGKFIKTIIENLANWDFVASQFEG